MDRPYIKSTIDSYLIDRDLDNTQEKIEELNNYIVDTVDYMKGNFECAYVAIHEMNRIEQQRYIYNLLDWKDEVLTEVEENIIDGDLVEEVLDPFSMIATVSALTIGGAITALLNKNGYKYLLNIKDFWDKRSSDKLKKILKDKKDIKRYDITRKIIGSNFNNCKRKAGFGDTLSSDEEKELIIGMHPNRKLYFGIGPNNVTPEQIDKAIQVRDCYIDYIISSIATLSILYNKCLIESGETQAGGASAEHGMAALLNYPTGETCQVLYDTLKDQHSAFLDVINVFFKDDQRERQNWIKRLDEKVIGAKRGEHLRPTGPLRHKGSFNQQGKFVSGKDKGFKERYINPSKQPQQKKRY
jgi:hypothetical protein